jgi:hypothetical protein
MPPIPPTPASRLLARTLRLPGRLLARRQGPRGLAAARVAERRRPHLARIGRRLSHTPLRAEPVFAPEGMSEFASRWIFGDGPAEGTPLGDSEARATLARASGPPSFQRRPGGADDVTAWPPIEVASSASVARTPIEEFGARRAQGFRLSSTPSPRQEAPAPEFSGPTGPDAPISAGDPQLESPPRDDAPAPVERVEPLEPEQPAQVAPVTPGIANPTVSATPPAPARTPAKAPPVRAVVTRSAAVRPTPRPGLAPLRLASVPAPGIEITPTSAPSGAALARASAGSASPRPGILRRALDAVGNVVAGRRARASTAGATPPAASGARGPEPITTAAPSATPARPGGSPPPPAAAAVARAPASAQPPGHALAGETGGQMATAEDDNPSPDPAPPEVVLARDTGMGAGMGAELPHPRADVTGAADAVHPTPPLEAGAARDVLPVIVETDAAAAGPPPVADVPSSRPVVQRQASAEASARTPRAHPPPAADATAAGGDTERVRSDEGPPRTVSRAQIARRADAGAAPEPESPGATLPAVPRALEGEATPSATPAARVLARRATGPTSPLAAPAEADALASGALPETGPAAQAEPVAPAHSSRAAREGAPAAAAGVPTATLPRAGHVPVRPLTALPARPLLRAARRAHETPLALGGPTTEFTSGPRLARALGLPLETQPDGSVSVSLPGAAASSTPAPGGPLLAREADASESTSAPAPVPNPAPATAAPPPAAAGAPPPSLDEIYEHVVEHLRRDLLVERERMGDLAGGLP